MSMFNEVSYLEIKDTKTGRYYYCSDVAPKWRNIPSKRFPLHSSTTVDAVTNLFKKEFTELLVYKKLHPNTVFKIENLKIEKVTRAYVYEEHTGIKISDDIVNKVAQFTSLYKGNNSVKSRTSFSTIARMYLNVLTSKPKTKYMYILILSPDQKKILRDANLTKLFDRITGYNAVGVRTIESMLLIKMVLDDITYYDLTSIT